jgi:hypothetical protein
MIQIKEQLRKEIGTDVGTWAMVVEKFRLAVEDVKVLAKKYEAHEALVLTEDEVLEAVLA